MTLEEAITTAIEFETKVRGLYAEACDKAVPTAPISSVSAAMRASKLVMRRASEAVSRVAEAATFAREQKASLVVMGALARSKLKQRVIGSTAARALDHIPCDVLVAHVKQHP